MIDVFRLDLPKAKLSALPKEERTLLLLLGHAANEVNVLQRLMKLTMNLIGPAPDPRSDHLSTSQTVILLRLLVGKLYEAWELFRTRVLSHRGMSDRCLPHLMVEANQSLDSLKQFFGKSNFISAIRNLHAFHNPSDEDMEMSFQAVPESGDWHFYISHDTGNSFYFASEIVVMVGALRAVGSFVGDATTVEAQFGVLCDTAIRVSRDFMTLFEDCIGVLVEQDFGPPSQEKSVTDAPKFSSLGIPFFIDFNQ